MSNEQKLREALLSDMDIAVLRMPVRMAFAGDMAQFQYHNRVQALLNRIEALALPTADHLPDAGKMIETAAPVGERDALDAARYRWLADCNNYPEAVTLISDGSLTADALGKAIDAAMRKGQP